MVYRKECCNIFEYIENVNFKKSGHTIVGSDVFTNNFLILVYRKECCKIFEYIQNVNLKRSGPTIVGPDAFTNDLFFLVGMLYWQVSRNIF